jgi:hypothetical protein
LRARFATFLLFGNLFGENVAGQSIGRLASVDATLEVDVPGRDQQRSQAASQNHEIRKVSLKNQNIYDFLSNI